jgi:XTP/dITP diphosphohydrolase
MKLLVATGNQGKLRELREMLTDLNAEVIGLSDVQVAGEPTEDGDTFEANAVKKARYYAERTGLVTIADDSGLSVDALDGRPGVLSARFSGPDATDAENNLRLLSDMAGVTNRRARFVCAAVCLKPDGKYIVTRGECEGEVLTATRGAGGFGYDPLFFVEEHAATFAELPPETKNRISHRGRALAELKTALPDFLSE